MNTNTWVPININTQLKSLALVLTVAHNHALWIPTLCKRKPLNGGISSSRHNHLPRRLWINYSCFKTLHSTCFCGKFTCGNPIAFCCLPMFKTTAAESCVSRPRKEWSRGQGAVQKPRDQWHSKTKWENFKKPACATDLRFFAGPPREFPVDSVASTPLHVTY